MRWCLLIRRRDYLTGEWKRSQIEIVHYDFSGTKTYKQVWQIVIKALDGRQFHTSQLRLERG